MNKRIIAIIVSMAVCFLAGYSISDSIHQARERKDRFLQQQFDNDAANKQSPYTYPQASEADDGISVTYTEEVLIRKAQGETLSQEENELIEYFKINEDGYGIAYTKYIEHDGGMGRSSHRIWETENSGQFWNVLHQGSYSVGYYDYTFIDNYFIVAGFATTAEDGYFSISADRGHRFISIPYTDVLDYDKPAYAKKVAENADKKTITYDWIDLYSHEVISTIEYDFDMNTVAVHK